MGFFKKAKKKFKKATGISVERAALAGVTGGLSEINLQAAEAGGVDFSDPFGTEAAADAAKRAAEEEKSIQQQNLDFRKLIFGESGEFRARAGEAGEELLSLARTPLSESEDFQKDLQEALVQQRLTLSAFGLGESTTAGTAFGETTAALASRERGKRTNILQFLAGGAETGLSASVGAQELSTRAGLEAAQSTANVGAIKAQGKQAAVQTGVDLLTFGAVAL